MRNTIASESPRSATRAKLPGGARAQKYSPDAARKYASNEP